MYILVILVILVGVIERYMKYYEDEEEIKALCKSISFKPMREISGWKIILISMIFALVLLLFIASTMIIK